MRKMYKARMLQRSFSPNIEFVVIKEGDTLTGEFRWTYSMRYAWGTDPLPELPFHLRTTYVMNIPQDCPTGMVQTSVDFMAEVIALAAWTRAIDADAQVIY